MVIHTKKVVKASSVHRPDRIFFPIYFCRKMASPKGQYISEPIFEIIVLPKMKTKYFKDFCPSLQKVAESKKNIVPIMLNNSLACFIYILDSSNSSSTTF